MTTTTQNIKSKTITGIIWNVSSRVGRQGLQFLTTVILARLLSPEEFGIAGMLWVFVGFANIYVELGFGEALIQKQDATPLHFHSIFWINFATGIALMLAFIFAAPFIADFYDQPLLRELTIFYSLHFILGAFGIVHLATLKKQMQFKTLAGIEMMALAIAGVVAIVMAYAGFGVWSLVAQALLTTAITSLLLWVKSSWRPALKFEWRAVKDMLGFSMSIIGFSSMNYWARNADNLLIGRFLSSAALGIYSRAYAVMLLPVRLISRTIGQVMFPAFSTIQEDKARVASIYLRMTATIALIAFPMMVGLWIVADHFVVAIFGPRWIEMAPVLKVFCIIGMVQSISTLEGNLYRSQGRADLQFKVGIIVSTLCVVSLAIGLQWGILGVAVAYCIFTIIISIPTTMISVSLINVRFFKVIKNLASVTLVSFAMGGLLYGIGFIIPETLPHGVHLIIRILAGGLIYFALLHVTKVEAWLNVKEIIFEQMKNRREKSVKAPVSAGTDRGCLKI